MSSGTYFLNEISDNSTSVFADATGNIQLSNYSQPATGSLTQAETDTLVKGGVALAIAQAGAVFRNDAMFSELFTQSTGVGMDGSFEIEANSKSEVVANFLVGSGEKFSFDFAAQASLVSTEIENPDAEYAGAKSKTAFLVLDTTNIDQPRLIDYFGISGKLISSKGKGKLKFGSSGGARITERNQNIDINGDNEVDFVEGGASGTYERQNRYKGDPEGQGFPYRQFTVVKINTSEIEVAGDTLIDNLGSDVIYGTIRKDFLIGTNGADKIYGSLGDDKLKGKRGDDILEGGLGNDLLKGNQGDDQLSGGWGDDQLNGGKDSDILVGGHGFDTFIFSRNDLQAGRDIIKDFEVGVDKIEFQGFGRTDLNWFNEVISPGLTNTADGALLSFSQGGQILFEGVNQLSFSDLA